MSNKHILYNADHQIVIYIPCQKGLPDDIPRHFSRNHGEISFKDRREIRKAVKGMRRCSIKEVYIPTEEVEPIEGIEILPGFKCVADEKCKEVTGTEGSMERSLS